MNILLEAVVTNDSTVLYAAIAAMGGTIMALVWFIIRLLRDLLQESTREKATTLKEMAATLASVAATVKTLGEILIEQQPRLEARARKGETT